MNHWPVLRRTLRAFARSAAPAAIACTLALAATPAAAQQVSTAVVPAGITVGDVFHAVIRVEGAGNAPVLFPDTLLLPAELEPAGRRRVELDSVQGAPRWTALYPLAGWRPGTHELPAAAVRVEAEPSPTLTTAAFPAVVIGSVLPADTAGIEPKPARDVLGANRVWWPILLGLLLLLATLAVLLWWWRRRRARRPVIELLEPPVPPRTAALAALDRARASGALERAEYKRFYSDVTEALRTYVAATDPVLGPDLTTAKLAAWLRRTGHELPGRPLIEVLQAADLVKFARRVPDPAAALAEWERARRFVETFEAGSAEAQRAA